MRVLRSIIFAVKLSALISACQSVPVSIVDGAVDGCLSSDVWKDDCRIVIYRDFVVDRNRCEEIEVDDLYRRHIDQIAEMGSDYLYEVVDTEENQRIVVYVVPGSIINESYSLNIEVTLSERSCLKLDMAEIVQ